ncbi:hypothetical protein [Sphingomonas sp. KR3-1]|uniref:hypothetical protein n=1 Tax=Sphingomonas sp. KR3-1 TaxID=3156611 RepID=UPI0032B41F71
MQYQMLSEKSGGNQMLFDDYFYPGNPSRRMQVAVLQGQIRADFQIFMTSWNDCANFLNPILNVNHPNLKLTPLTCNPDCDDVQMCLNQINSVLTDAKGKLDKLLSDIGIQNGVAGMVPGALNSDPEAQNKIRQFISGAADVAIASFAAWYTYVGIQTIAFVLTYTGIAISETAAFLAGALGGMIVGAVAFVITDVIASAITGAIERKELNEAIDALTQFRSQVADPLMRAAGRLAGISQAVKDGSYLITDTLLILRRGNGYTVIEVPPTVSTDGLGLDVLVHLQNIGDVHYHAGEWAGTKGQARRLEGFQITANSAQSGLSWEYMAHLENIGDTGWTPAGTFVGTRGQARRLEGFAIRLTGAQAANYTVQYMAHLENIGDSAPVSDGAFCGTRGQARRVEAIYVTIKPR